MLIDNSGRNIKEIYSHGKGNDSHILAKTEQIILDAIQEQASDILIDPKGDETYTIRFRIDGVLSVVEIVDTDTCQAIVNSIKAVANMDIAEKRRPQDGSFAAKTLEGPAAFRVASAGVLNGEKLSIRVLSQKAGMFTLTNIGLSNRQGEILTDYVTKPSGMVLLSGPTGSGKTTTLYAMLNKIDLFTRNVVTVEDPIEYVLANASQIEVNTKAGITFAKSLRSILRQDPDIICVGEIRDEETAALAMRAAQTGHLVLATIHSNSNASALVRLLDLGIAPGLLVNGLNLIVSQRLIRKLCDQCKEPLAFDKRQVGQLRKEGLNPETTFQAAGCQECRDTGYRGRTGIFDLLPITDKLRTSIASNQMMIDQLRKKGDNKGRSNLKRHGLVKVSLGITTLEELNRVVG